MNWVRAGAVDGRCGSHWDYIWARAMWWWTVNKFPGKLAGEPRCGESGVGWAIG